MVDGWMTDVIELMTDPAVGRTHYRNDRELLRDEKLFLAGAR